MAIFLGLLIPLLGTILGSATVFLMKNKINKKIEKILLGFAAGVMIAASIRRARKDRLGSCCHRFFVGNYISTSFR